MFSAIHPEYIILFHLIWLELYTQTPFFIFSFAPLLLLDYQIGKPLSFVSMMLQHGTEYLTIIKNLLFTNAIITAYSFVSHLLHPYYPYLLITSYDFLCMLIFYGALLMHNMSTWAQYRRLLYKIKNKSRNANLAPSSEEMARLLAEGCN